MREIQKREDIRWVIYTDSPNSMLAIENKRGTILAELHNQGKQITLCKVPAHIVIKGNEEADQAAKQAIDMPVMDGKERNTISRIIKRHF